MVKAALASILCAFALAAQGLWERKADFPLRATEVSGAAIAGKVYVVCGITDQGGSTNRLFVYDILTDTWTEKARAPLDGGGDHCNVAAANGKLYLLGAIRISGSFIDGNTYEYDPGTDRWQMVATMTIPRAASGVAVIGSKIYVAGGLAGGRSVATFDSFDVTTRQWTRLPDMLTARDHLTAQAVDGRFYAIGGRAGAEFTANEEFDPASNMWRSRAPLPTARGGLGSGVINGRIVVFGGEGASGTPDGTYRQNEEYDPAANTWRSLAPMPVPRHGLYGITLDGRIFVPSGGPRAGGNFSDHHDAFYLPPAPAPRVGGVRNAASFDATLAPGAIASIFGDRLAAGEQAASRFPLTTQMNAVTVRVNGALVPLLYTGPGQTNFVIPHAAAAGPSSIVVSNAGIDSAAFSAEITPAAPAIFTLDRSGSGQGVILIAGTGLIARATRDAFSRAAVPGDIVEIYTTGLGRLNSVIDPLQPAPTNPLAETTVTPVVTIGGQRAQVLFSGLAPGLSGVYQVNARVAANSALGIAVPVTIQVGDDARQSNTVTMAVIAAASP